ncbi:MAG: CinA family protein [Ruminococcaceae bacterium]|nr:CinA family protein [Oscillospiraceae bacterium]
MMSLAFDVLSKLQGKTLVTAESCTGGGIGNALTAVPGASAVYKGGIISYCNEVKAELLKVSRDTLFACGAVSAPVAREMARGARETLQADIAVSVTGLAGPDGDEFGNPVGTVFVGYADAHQCIAKQFHFAGDRAQIRHKAVEAALKLVLELS